MTILARFVVRVVPPSKKNSEQIVRLGKRYAVQPSAQYKAATKIAVPQLVEQWENLVGPNGDHVDFAIGVCCTLYVLCRSDSGNAPDLLNLLHAPADWMQAPKRSAKTGEVVTPGADIIADDRLIRSWDGSRIVFMCDGCPDRKSGCNYRFQTRLKKDGTPWMRKGKPVRDKVQVCQRGWIEIELFELLDRTE